MIVPSAGRVRGAPSTHRSLVGDAAEPEIGDRTVDAQAREEGPARLRVNEAIDVEGADVGVRYFARVAEAQLQMGIGGDRGCGLGTKHPDIHTHLYGFKEARERRRASFHVDVSTWAGPAWAYACASAGTARPISARRRHGCRPTPRTISASPVSPHRRTRCIPCRAAPTGDVAVRGPRFHEAVFVAAMTAPLASAETARRSAPRDAPPRTTPP